MSLNTIFDSTFGLETEAELVRKCDGVLRGGIGLKNGLTAVANRNQHAILVAAQCPRFFSGLGLIFFNLPVPKHLRVR